MNIIFLFMHSFHVKQIYWNTIKNLNIRWGDYTAFHIIMQITLCSHRCPGYQHKNIRLRDVSLFMVTCGVSHQLFSNSQSVLHLVQERTKDTGRKILYRLLFFNRQHFLCCERPRGFPLCSSVWLYFFQWPMMFCSLTFLANTLH